MEPRSAIARITTELLVSVVAFDAVLRNSGDFDDCSRLTGFKEIPISSGNTDRCFVS